jgi:phospholipid transport system substrate-binding protein
MKSLKLSLTLLLAGFITSMAPVVVADNAKADPFTQIEQVTGDLLTVISTYSEEYPANEQSYFAALAQLMQEHVDFAYISRQVMGPYKAQATPQQRQLFETKFRDGLIETYGRGLIGYGNEEIVLVNRSDLKAGQRKVSVKQEIRSDGVVYPMEYSMALSKRTGQWKAINVIINGINMRNIFRSQFVNAAQKSGGDIDLVIAGWSTES